MCKEENMEAEVPEERKVEEETDPKEMARRVLEMHGEEVTQNHMEWLARECSKIIKLRAEAEEMMDKARRAEGRGKGKGKGKAAPPVASLPC